MGACGLINRVFGMRSKRCGAEFPLLVMCSSGGQTSQPKLSLNTWYCQIIVSEWFNPPAYLYDVYTIFSPVRCNGSNVYPVSEEVTIG